MGAVKRIGILRGLASLTSDLRDKYRPKNFKGDATGRLGLAVTHSQKIK